MSRRKSTIRKLKSVAAFIPSLAYKSWVVLILFIGFFTTLFLIILASLFYKNNKGAFAVIRFISRGGMILVGIRVKNIYENEELKKNEYPPCCIFISNHVSYIDIFTAYLSKLPYFLFLAKSDLLSIPLFSYIYSKLIIGVKRERLVDRKESMERMIEAIAEKRISLYIFPEGAFNETERPYIPFKLGAFSLAVRMQKPIYPLLFLDTRRRWRHESFFGFSPGENKIYHLAPIVDHIGTNMTPLRLMEHSYAYMLEKWNEYAG